MKGLVCNQLTRMQRKEEIDGNKDKAVVIFGRQWVFHGRLLSSVDNIKLCSVIFAWKLLIQQRIGLFYGMLLC